MKGFEQFWVWGDVEQADADPSETEFLEFLYRVDVGEDIDSGMKHEDIGVASAVGLCHIRCPSSRRRFFGIWLLALVELLFAEFVLRETLVSGL